jgi:hypothetical protein
MFDRAAYDLLLVPIVMTKSSAIVYNTSSMMKAVIRRLVPAPLLSAYKTFNYRRHHGSASDPASIFGNIYKKRLWGKGESVSGTGSTVNGTAIFRAELEQWLERNRIGRLVDLPCGDFHWMRRVGFPPGMRYTGMDIVPELVADVAKRYASGLVSFEAGDILNCDLPEADAYLCKDLFIHFPNEAIERAVRRLRGKTSFLLATTFPDTPENHDIRFGEARRVNMACVLGEPVEMLRDFDDRVKDRFVGVWRL